MGSAEAIAGGRAGLVRRTSLRGARFVGLSLTLTVAIMAMALLAFGCQPQAPKKVERAEFVLGGTARIIAYGDSAEGAMEKVFAECRRLEKITNLYDPESETMALNRSRKLSVSPELYAIIERCKHFSKWSDGAFDITVGSLTKLWNITGGPRKEWPTPEEVAEQSHPDGYQSIVLDKKSRRVTLLDPDILIDVWGAAKGYAAEKGAEILRGDGVKSALINVGGSIAAVGTPPDKDAWDVGIQHPRNPAGLLDVVKLHDGEALATSGDYERYQTKGTKRVSHIFNPKTGLPVEEMQETTIRANNALDADILSTATFVMGTDAAQVALTKIPHVSYILVAANGAVVQSTW